MRARYSLSLNGAEIKLTSRSDPQQYVKSRLTRKQQIIWMLWKCLDKRDSLAPSRYPPPDCAPAS